MRSRIIAKDDALDVDRWDAPPVDASAADALRGADHGGAHLLTARQLDQLQRQAYDEAYQRGLAEGLTAGKQELAARMARLSALADAAAEPLKTLDQSVEDELVALAVALASRLVRREIEHDPALLRAAIHDCLSALPSSAREVTFYFHPDDAALVAAQSPTGERAFRLAEDPDLARGDLRLASTGSQVDGRLEIRLAAIVGATLAQLETEGRADGR